MFASQKKQTRESTLRAKPVRNLYVTEEARNNGEVTLIIPIRKDRWVRFLRKILYIPEARKIRLDRIGGWVWDRCNGQMNAGEMIENLADEFKLSPKEAKVSLLAFLRKLGEKRLVGFMIDEKC